MPHYKYTARDERGNALNGALSAHSPEALADELKRMGYLVTRCREASEPRPLFRFAGSSQRVGYDALILFDVQLSKMVQVGIPLLTALSTLSQQIEHPALREVIRQVAKSVEGGMSFSEALVRHPRVFADLFVQMVRAGEISGKLDQILRRLATWAKHQAELRNQLRTAVTYPAVLLAVGAGATMFLIMGIIPKFMTLFMEAGVPLPLPTQLLYRLSRFLQQYWWTLALEGLALALGLRWYHRTASGRRRLDWLMFRLPVIGDLSRKTSVSRMSRTLETLLSSGVPVLESLAIAERTCGNTLIAECCRAAQQHVKEGGTIAEPLKSSREFPPMVVQMIAIGESSGTLDYMLGEIAEHYDETVQHGLRRLTTLIEPVCLIVIGGIVTLIMTSILIPLFRMVSVIH